MSINAAKIRIKEARLYAQHARISLTISEVPRVRILAALRDLEEALDRAQRDLESAEVSPRGTARA